MLHVSSGRMTWIQLELSDVRLLETANFGYSQGQPHPDRTTGYHDLLLIEEGEWEVWEERQRFLLRGSEVLFLFSGRHHYGNLLCRPGTRWIYLHFAPRTDDRFLHSAPTQEPGGMGVVLPSQLSIAGNPQIAQLFRDIVYCFWSSLSNHRQRARVLLSVLLLELARLGHHSDETGHASRLESVLRCIEREPKKMHTLDELASLARMSRRLLTREFRKRTGRSIHRYQLEQKVRIAQSLVQHNPGIRLKELAEMLGFYDAFHFSKTFKRLTGKSLNAKAVRRT